MLVTLANQTALVANASQTFTYSAKSLQKLMIHQEDIAGSGAATGNVTVQIGSRTICNGVSYFGLMGFTALKSNPAQDTGNGESFICVDFGSHTLVDNENIYVTVQPTQDITGIDISLIVDEPKNELPIFYTEYSDETFTAEGVLKAMNYNSAKAAVDDDAYNCSIRNALQSSSPTFTSANSYFLSQCYNDNALDERFGVLINSDLPYTTTFNYSSSAVTDRILVASTRPTSKRKQLIARNNMKYAVQRVS